MAPPVRATGTLTSDATIPTAADVVLVGGVTYTWRAAVGATANEVLLGVSYTTAMDNLAAAINAGTGSGTLYGSATVANPEAIATRSGATIVVTAKTPGTAGNFITLAETGTHTTVTGALLTGGTGNVFDYVDEILNGSQVNSDVIARLNEVRSTG